VRPVTEHPVMDPRRTAPASRTLAIVDTRIRPANVPASVRGPARRTSHGKVAAAVNKLTART
jgi:hypothetical protein